MGIEIEFFPVGENSKCGDAIAVRYGTEGNFTVMIVDCGSKATAKIMIDHVKNVYQTSQVDYLVNTHPDSDHISGLISIMEELNVRQLWMHLPWEQSDDIMNLIYDDLDVELKKYEEIIIEFLRYKIKDCVKKANELLKIAEIKGVEICEPFEGAVIGAFRVLSPNQEWYTNELLPNFPKMPQEEISEKELIDFVKSQSRLRGIFDAAPALPPIPFDEGIVERAIDLFVPETWGTETLKETNVETTARNESSVVMYADIGGDKVLLTGDAGIEALDKSLTYADTIGIDLQQCQFTQMPHHGSRHNVSPSILDRLLGEKVPEGTKPTRTSFVSVSKEAVENPRKVVVNAFLRRGATVFETRGQRLRFHKDMPSREDKVNINPLPFNDTVEGNGEKKGKILTFSIGFGDETSHASKLLKGGD